MHDVSIRLHQFFLDHARRTKSLSFGEICVNELDSLLGFHARNYTLDYLICDCFLRFLFRNLVIFRVKIVFEKGSDTLFHDSTLKVKVDLF